MPSPPLDVALPAALGSAVALVYLITPLAVRVAGRLEFFDRPVGYKGHAAPTPYLGGAAVVTGFAVVALLLAGDPARSAPVLGGVLLLWLVGTVDDRRTLTPAVRMAVEIGLAWVLWALGLGWGLGLGAAVDLVVTAAWLVAVVNAFNFFDNMDGSSASMAAVASAGLAALGLVAGDAWLTVTAAALCGACVGFLPHNLIASPARIFLGDGGSMPVGFAVAALAMVGTSGTAAGGPAALAIAVLLVGVPAMDTTLVIVSRLRRGIPILTGGRDHVTHRVRQVVGTPRRVALVLGGAQAAVSALALSALAAGGAVVLAAALYLLAACAAIVVLDTRLRPAAPAVGDLPVAATRAGPWRPGWFGSPRMAPAPSETGG